MRTQFLLVGLLSGVAGMLVGTAGCDDITTGQSTDSKVPPQLQHVLVQDDMPSVAYLFSWPYRGFAYDLIDNHPIRQCTITCKGNCPGDATNPAPPQEDTCINEFTVGFVAPDVHCLDSGVCNDPYKLPASGVPIPLSAIYLGAAASNGDPGGGIQIRLVFDKVLDNSIESVTPSGSMTPGKTNTYALNPGIVELDDMSGKPVDSLMYYDNGGSYQYSADIELVPLGPAIVIKPKNYLDPASTYTIKILNPGAIKDREGNAATALGGGALMTSYPFTTETLTPASAGAFGLGPFDYPDFSKPPAINGNDVIQISFFGNVAGDTATVTETKGPAAKILAYSDRGNDPTMCSKTDPGSFVLDITNTDTGAVASAQPAEWPAGDYTLHVSVKDINGRSTYENDYSFTVGVPCMMDSDCASMMCDTAAGVCKDASDPMLDPNIQSQHVTPAQCTM